MASHERTSVGCPAASSSALIGRFQLKLRSCSVSTLSGPVDRHVPIGTPLRWDICHEPRGACRTRGGSVYTDGFLCRRVSGRPRWPQSCITLWVLPMHRSSIGPISM